MLRVYSAPGPLNLDICVPIKGCLLTVNVPLVALSSKPCVLISNK